MHLAGFFIGPLEWHQLYSFQPSRNIQQGDSLSSYLFVLCMEVLSYYIHSAVENGHWNGIKLSRNGPKLSHLCFADDFLLFGVANESRWLSWKRPSKIFALFWAKG